MKRRETFFLGIAFLCVFAFSVSMYHIGGVVGAFASGKQAGKTKLIIDAGHGGEDGGAVGKENLIEKEVNLDISKALFELMSFCGVDAIMTRDKDISLYSEDAKSLRQKKISDTRNRVKLISLTSGGVLISIHQNSFPQNNCKGAQVFYSENNVESKLLAENVQNSLKHGLSDGNHRIEKPADRRIYLLENVNCPAVLVECGFLTNDKESKLLATPEYRVKLAFCIARGFFEYMKEV